MITPIAQDYCRKWHIDIERELHTFCSDVYFGMRGGTAVVLKIPHPHMDEVHQGRMLAAYAGQGMVRVLELADEAMLLEHIRPGHPLSQLTYEGRDEQATIIFCETAQKLHAARLDEGVFRPVRHLAGAFDRYLQRGETLIAREDIMRAKELFLALSDSQGVSVALHGDLHHDNILWDESRGWLAIDPKGYAGEAMFEAGVFLRNPLREDRYQATQLMLAARLDMLSHSMGWDRQRLLSWAYAQAMLSAVWSVEDKQDPQGSLDVAKMLRAL